MLLPVVSAGPSGPGASLHDEAEDREQDHDADDGADDPAEVEAVVVADTEHLREDQPPEQRARVGETLRPAPGAGSPGPWLPASALVGGMPDRDQVQRDLSWFQAEDLSHLLIGEGPDRHAVGQVAADLRGFYPPEPYKGKGVRYVGEKIVRKEGKTVQ